jgi:hypothetical protein
MYNGPKIPTEGIVFALDASSLRGVSGTGNTSYNGAPSAAKNIVNRGENVSTVNGTRLTNVNYYTAFAIDYPEGSYGGAGAGRHGLTAGFNVTAGSKVFDYGRALNYAVFDNNTQTFVKTTVYDSYVGTAAVDSFVSEYYQMVAQYPNATHIVAGSHRDSYHTEAQYTILRDLGAPSNVNSIIGFSSPEWILVGEPGLGAGNAYGWAFQNYSTNPDQVAHLVFPLPLKGNKSSGFLFDGTNQYIDLPQNYQSGFTQATYMFVCKPSSLPSGTYRQLYIQESSTWIGLYSYGGAIFFGIDLHNGSGWFDNNGGFNTGARTTSTLVADRYYHVVYSWNGSNVSVYLNGSLEASVSTLQASNGRQNVTTLGAGSTYRNIGSRYSGGGNNWIGEINAVTMYNRALSATEVTQAYNAYRSRFNF